MRIRLFFFSQMLACLLISAGMVTYSASASVTIDFRYALQDGAGGNGAKVKIQIQQGDEIEEIFEGETVGVGVWAPAQSVELPKRFVGKDITLIWVSDPIDENMSSDWLVVEDPWLVVNGVKTYSFFDSHTDAEFTTIAPGGGQSAAGPPWLPP